MTAGPEGWRASLTMEAAMYEAPMLVQYGTFRELTLHHPTTNAKRFPLVNDLATVFGPGGNIGCNPHAQPFSHAGCMST